MKEVWKYIPEYEELYKISNLGRVKSLERQVWNGYKFHILKERIMNLHANHKKGGYLQITISKNCKQKTFTIHSLVAIVFLSHKPDKFNGLIIDHINNIVSDNRVENLQLITQRQNVSKNKDGYSSNYVGVCFNKERKKYVASIFISGKNNFIGYFNNELDAHLAYQKKLKLI